MNTDKPDFEVRPARIEEYGLLVDIFNRVFKKNKDLRTLEWKYLQNPHGKSIVWVAVSGKGEIVGSLAFVPRRMRIEGREVLTFLASDGMVFPEWQRQGIFVRLLHIMFEKSWAMDAPLVIAFSGRRSVQGLVRTDWVEVSRVKELFLPLRGTRRFGKIIRRLPFSAGLFGPVGDVLLEHGRLKLFLQRSFTTRVEPIKRFNDALANLATQASEKVRLSLIRDKAYLNWRFVDNPTKRHRCFGAYRNSEAAGYLVMETAGGRSYIADLIALDAEARDDLLARAVKEARKGGGETVQCMALKGDAIDRYLLGQGFKCRPKGGLLPFMVKFGPAGGEEKEAVADSRLWYLSHGDQDAAHMTP